MTSWTLARRAERLNPSTIREILKITERPGIISLAGGLPSADTFPVQAMREATATVLRDTPREALQYAASEGFEPLREWVAAELAGRNAVESQLRADLFHALARLAHADPPERPQRELWVNTSEAEIQAAVSPLYELSKRLQGQLLSLRSLDLAGPKLRIRRLVLGPFRSALNPIGVMDAGFVAREILRQVGWNCSLVIVTPNPLTYVLMPLATVSRWLYFSLVSRPSP